MYSIFGDVGICPAQTLDSCPVEARGGAQTGQAEPAQVGLFGRRATAARARATFRAPPRSSFRPRRLFPPPCAQRLQRAKRAPADLAQGRSDSRRARPPALARPRSPARSRLPPRIRLARLPRPVPFSDSFGLYNSFLLRLLSPQLDAHRSHVWETRYAEKDPDRSAPPRWRRGRARRGARVPSPRHHQGQFRTGSHPFSSDDPLTMTRNPQVRMQLSRSGKKAGVR